MHLELVENPKEVIQYYSVPETLHAECSLIEIRLCQGNHADSQFFFILLYM